MAIKIIDISGYNPSFDLRAVKAAGYAGAYIKATEGTGYTNPYFAAQRQAAIDAGLAWGAYHFFHPGTDANAQAQHFVQVAGRWAPGQLAPCADIETTDGVSPQGVTNASLAFMQAVEGAFGRQPILYTGKWFWDPATLNSGPLGAYPLWISNYSAAPNICFPWTSAALWQYTDNEAVPGIPVPCDVSAWQGTEADFAAFIGSTGGAANVALVTPAPAPAPDPLLAAVAGLQRAVHVTADNIWGPATEAALVTVWQHQHNRAEQAAVGTTVDGIWGPASQAAETQCVKDVQAALGVATDGIWGLQTANAYNAVRAVAYHG